MPPIATVQPVSPVTFDRLAHEFLDHNYRQVHAYAKLAADSTNSQCEIVSICINGATTGLAIVRVKMVPFLPIGIAYVLGGPLVNRRDDEGKSEDTLNQVFEALVQHYVHEMGLVLRVAGPVEGLCPPHNRLDVMHRHGFRAKPENYRTILVDLQRSEDEVRKSFHQKWRNCLNKAEKTGVNIRHGTADELFAVFAPMLDSLKEKKDFQVNQGTGFFREVQKRANEDEKFVVHIAEIDGSPVAGHIGSILGDTGVYLLGASNGAGNKVSASYLLQWRFMLLAMQRGARWYDLGGIDPDENPGVFRFKNRMGGSELSIPVMEISGGLSGALMPRIESIYRRIRGQS